MHTREARIGLDTHHHGHAVGADTELGIGPTTRQYIHATYIALSSQTTVEGS